MENAEHERSVRLTAEALGVQLLVINTTQSEEDKLRALREFLSPPQVKSYPWVRTSFGGRVG